jgi:superoxide reductase
MIVVSGNTRSGIGAAAVAGLALVLLFGWGSGSRAWAQQEEEEFTPEFRETHRSLDARHSPKITAPGSVKRGQWFDVTISVGTGGDHPSLMEHFVRYIALYKDSVEIARAYLHPVYSFPKVTFTIALDEGGALRAVEEPNHSAAWETSQKIVVVP